MLIELKLIAAVVIVLVALAGGYFALRLGTSERAAHRLSLGNAFAGGIFLGAALIHFFGDAQEHMNIALESEVRWAAMIAGVGFLLVLVPERVFVAASHDRAVGSGERDGTTYAILLTAVLSIHSMIAGIAMGLETQPAALAGVLIAILAHKGSAAFALMAVMQQANATGRAAWRALFVLLMMTPTGIVLGLLLGRASAGEEPNLAEGIFDALAAGTFLYVASMELINEVFTRHKDNLLEFTLLSVGFILMALLSLAV